MAPSTRRAPSAPPGEKKHTPSPSARFEKKASFDAGNEKTQNDASPVPAVVKRARSRGGRRVHVTSSEETPKDPPSPPKIEGDDNDDALHWGRQKARGAEPVKSAGGADGADPENADPEKLADADRAGAVAASAEPAVGKAALLVPARNDADVLNDARARTLFPVLKRQSSADPDSVGFTSLLQLADAGVQLEKRARAPGGSVPGAPDARARGRKAPAEGRRADGRRTAAENGAKHAKKGGKKGSGDDGALSSRGGKKRGRGPNKVQETEEEREAKRQRRVQANRESARQTIRRKHEQYDDLNGRAVALEASNAALRREMAALFGEMRALAATNFRLREQVVDAAKKKGVPVPDIGDGAAAAAAAAATAPVVAAAPARSTHAAAAARAAAKPSSGPQSRGVPGAGNGAGPMGSVHEIGPKGSGSVSGATSGALTCAPDVGAGVVGAMSQTAVAAAPFANGVAAALGGAVPAGPGAAGSWPGGPAAPAAMWVSNPFANVFGAMAAAASRGTGAPAEGTAGGGPVPGGASFFGAGAPMMMPFFYPAMGMAAGGFAWPPAGAGAEPGAPAPARAAETSEPAARPEPSRGKQTLEESARTPPA